MAAFNPAPSLMIFAFFPSTSAAIKMSQADLHKAGPPNKAYFTLPLEREREEIHIYYKSMAGNLRALPTGQRRLTSHYTSMNK